MVEKGPENSLKGRKLYVPQMTTSGAQAFAAAFRSVGIDATVSPDSDERTLQLGAKYSSGDECYPEQVTLGDFMKVIESPGFDPAKTAFFMPTANGPCRFGQYGPYIRKVLRELKIEEALVISPTSANGYEGVGESAVELMRTAWRALLGADILRKVMLKTRPYEFIKGETDRVHAECLNDLCSVVERQGISHRERLSLMVESLKRSRDRFRSIPARYNADVPLIGLVGEIFCRLNRFSNSELIRKVEELGGECWQSDVSEWVWYTNVEQKTNLIQQGKRISLAMAGALLKHHIQHSDEHALLKPFHEDFAGYEEPTVAQVLKNGEPYLPHGKVLGEMVLSMGKSIYYYTKGADGIIDISPFTCMNGIVSEAVYPRLSRDHDHIPIRNFFFDGTYQDLDRDVGIFLELARTYKKKKKPSRKYPWYFPGPPADEKTA